MTAPPRIALVGCVKTKRQGTHEAKDLYVSPLFVRRRAYVERLGLPWFILSAAHGLVAPEERLHDYERTLNRMTAGERRAWGERVIEDLRTRLGDLAGLVVEVHAGSHYVKAVEAGLRASGATIVVPTAHLGLGEELAWYGPPHRPAGPGWRASWAGVSPRD